MDELNLKMQQVADQAYNAWLIEMFMQFMIVAAIIGVAIWALNKHFKNEAEKRNIERRRGQQRREEPKIDLD